jgi:ADP-ribose pyrophosphatase
MTSSGSNPLPRLPAIRVELVEDISPEQHAGWLRFIRHRLRAHYPDGAVSDPFEYDAIHRVALDAVVIVAHYRGADGRRHVHLRSAVRPPLMLREAWRQPRPQSGICLWELPAGLVDPGDYQDGDGARAAARRELSEELGFESEQEEIRALGPSIYPTPGIIAEMHHFFEVEVDPARRGEPSLDGSALERSGMVITVELEQALDMCRRGSIPDGKTELGLRRLKERVG